MSDPYVPFYTSDFLAGTSGMTSSTKGVYITLLCLMYEAEGPLPQKWDTLSRRCGCTLPAFKRAISDLEDDGKIDVSDDGLWSKKCEKHITQRRERSDSARSAAKKRWEKTEQKQGKADANASSAQCQPEPEPEPYKEEAKASLSPTAQKPKNPRGSRIPENWVLSKDLGDWSLDEGASEDLIRSEASKFLDYWRGVPGAKGRKQDWDATWRNWIRRAIENNPKPQFKAINGGQYGQSPNNHPQLDAIAIAARAGRASS